MSVEPRKAAACILARGKSDLEVLLGRRNPSLRFMANHHVFPGGRISDRDGADAVKGADDPEHAATIAAVVREVFEETGLLCVDGELPGAGAARQAREALLAEEQSFAEILERFSLSIDAAQFAFAGYWVTPKPSPIRFATHYYLYHVRSDDQEELIEGELVGLDWMRPVDARRRWHQGEIKLPSPVAYTLQHLATGPLDSALRRLARGPERPAAEHNRWEIRRGVTVIPLESRTIPPATHTNCVIIGEEALYVIDPGAEDAGELEHLARQLDHLIELGGRVEAVVLSHSHRDHTDGAQFVKEKYGAPILAHEAVGPQIDFPIDRHIGNGEILTSAGDPQWRLQAIHTPGHDPGHLCFLEQSTGVLLAGDMVANPGTIVVSRSFGGDMAQFMESLQRLLEIDCRLIVPSHGQPLGDPKEALTKNLEHRRWRERKIQEAYSTGAQTMDDLLARAYDDAPAAALPWARHSLDAHLAKLGIEFEGQSLSPEG